MDINKIIAADYDGMIVTNAWPELGEPIWKNIDALKKEISKGTRVILWTCRCGPSLAEAVIRCEEFGLELSAINDNLPEVNAFFNGNSRKIWAHEYWDDKAVLKNDKE